MRLRRGLLGVGAAIVLLAASLFASTSASSATLDISGLATLSAQQRASQATSLLSLQPDAPKAPAQLRRAELGLGPATAALTADPAALARGQAFGIPLTEAEAAQLRSHLTVQRIGGDVVRKARSIAPAAFGGAWYDLGDGTLHVAFTGGKAAELLGTLRAGLDQPDRVVTTQVRFSKAELDDAGVRLLRQRSVAAAKGIEVLTAGVYDDANLVVVTVEKEAPGTRDELAELYDLDPDMLLVEQSRTDAANDAPEGGERVGVCSAGPFGWVGSHPVLTTAGHCLDDGQYYYQSPNDTTSIIGGPWSTEAQSISGTTDAQRMSNGSLDVTRWVQAWAQGSVFLANVDPPYGSYDIQGSTVCQSGYVTQNSGNCGPVQSNNISCYDEDGNTFTNLRRADYSRNGGDSGSVVYGFNWTSSVPLVGLHKGACHDAVSAVVTYTHQSQAKAALGITRWEAE